MGLKFAKRNKLLNSDIENFYIPNFKCKSEICIGATELCKKYCYGNCVYRHSDNPDKKMLSTEAVALENYRITQTDSFIGEMDTLIKKTCNISRIRIHSIGDFYSYEYFLKWIEIIKQHPQINFTAYVKNFEVLEKYKKDNGKTYDNFNVLLSLYPDTYDMYKSKGGKQYIDELFKELVSYYGAKIYIVCSREFFRKAIDERPSQKYFCNGGTEMLSEWDKKLDINSYSNLFVPGEGCDKCLKCYSNKVCPKGATIYALLRASSKLANIEDALKEAPADKFTELRKMYPNEI